MLSSPRMMSTLTGIQIGPRQLELPPNMPVFDSAGRYCTLYSLPGKVKRERMIEVIASTASVCRKD